MDLVVSHALTYQYIRLFQTGRFPIHRCPNLLLLKYYYSIRVTYYYIITIRDDLEKIHYINIDAMPNVRIKSGASVHQLWKEAW